MRNPRGRLLPILAATALLAIVVVGFANRGAVLPADPQVARQTKTLVIDGDTLQLGGSVVQIYGIDAPELGQRCFYDGQWVHCGLNAALELRALIQKEHGGVHCTEAPGTTPETAQVCLAGSVDVATVLLKSGYVVAAADTTEGYREAEASARAASLGLWHSEFVPPVAWRAGKRAAGEIDAASQGCPIKAVISRTGDHFYYVPTDDDYLSLTSDAADTGPRFCSDEAARKAGWRRDGEAASSSSIEVTLRPYGIATVME